MSRLVPILLRDMVRPFRQLEAEMRQFEDDFFRGTSTFFNRPKYFIKYPDDGTQVTTDKDKFQVRLDVDAFKPEEIKVKTITDKNLIEIEAKHEEREDDHGLVSRHFIRRFLLPKGADLKGVVSSLSQDGILTVTAPKKVQEIGEEKSIPVEHVTEEKKDV